MRNGRDGQIGILAIAEFPGAGKTMNYRNAFADHGDRRIRHCQYQVVKPPDGTGTLCMWRTCVGYGVPLARGVLVG
jgi:hypothetical protein